MRNLASLRIDFGSFGDEHQACLMSIFQFAHCSFILGERIKKCSLRSLSSPSDRLICNKVVMYISYFKPEFEQFV